MEKSALIYLDYNATTPIAPEAAAAMAPFLEAEFGNPSNDYDLGLRARAAVDLARGQLAGLINARPEEIVFTSGGTESNNTVLKGVFYRRSGPVHMITARTEHPAVINPAIFLLNLGADVTFLTVRPDGLIDPDDLRMALRPETALVSIMLANNETGVIQPLAELAGIVHEHGALIHTDAAQAVGKVPVDAAALDVDFLTVAEHKLYAPKGVGALFVRRGVEFEPLLHGAGQESGRRAGTENVLLTVGLGAAAELAAGLLDREAERQAGLRDRLYEKLKAGRPDLVLVGHPEKRLPNTLNVCLPGLAGTEILAGGGPGSGFHGRGLPRGPGQGFPGARSHGPASGNSHGSPAAQPGARRHFGPGGRGGRVDSGFGGPPFVRP